MKILIDRYDGGFAKLSVSGVENGLNPIHYIVSCLTFFEEGYQYTYAFKHGLHDGRKCLYNRKSNTFPLGLVQRVYMLLRDRFPGSELVVTDELKNEFVRKEGNITEEEVNEYISTLGMQFPPRDYQMQMVLGAINRRRRTFSACTGSGKSLVVYLLSRYFMEKENKDVLIIVPSMSLVEQIYSDFQEYGWESISGYCSKLHSQVEKPSKEMRKEMEKYQLLPDNMLKRIVISTWQSLAPKKKEFFRRFEAVICDEAHSSRADVLSGIIMSCTNATVRIGLSGTIPSDSGLDGNIVTGCLGYTDHIVAPKDLIERGVLTPTRIITVKVPYDERSRKAVRKMKYAEEVDATASCGALDKVIETLISHGKITTDENTIILVKHTAILKNIKAMIEEKFPDAGFTVLGYHGAVNAATRERIRKDVDEKPGHILVCTYGTMKQGVNIKWINNIIFGQGSSSLITVKQSIGRGLRKHPKKDILTIYDVVDDLSEQSKRGKLHENYAVKHYNERLKFYADDDYPITEVTVPFVASFDDIKLKLDSSDDEE